MTSAVVRSKAAVLLLLLLFLNCFLLLHPTTKNVGVCSMFIPGTNIVFAFSVATLLKIFKGTLRVLPVSTIQMHS